ncbi:MAG: LamG domain-containing protein [Methanosarcinales archaeon]
MPTFRGVRLVSNQDAVLRNGLAAEWLMNESGSTLTDTSGNGNDVTIYGASWYTLPSGYKVLSFDGNDYCEKSHPSSALDLEQISILAWARSDISGPAYDLPGFIVNRKMTMSGTWALFLDQYISKVAFQVRLDGSEGDVRKVYADDILDTEWHYYAGIYDGKEVNLYVDGVLQHDVLPITGVIDKDNPQTLRIGSHPDNISYWRGLVGPLRIYERALQPWEIQAIMNYDKALMGV